MKWKWESIRKNQEEWRGNHFKQIKEIGRGQRRMNSEKKNEKRENVEKIRMNKNVEKWKNEWKGIDKEWTTVKNTEQ